MVLKKFKSSQNKEHHGGEIVENKNHGYLWVLLW